MKSLETLISRAYDRAEAARCLQFRPTQAQLQQVGVIGRDVLIMAEPTAGACVLMSALLTVGLRDHLKLPAVQVAGSLVVDSYRYFDGGGATATDFAQSNRDWAGHSWVMLGPLIGDVSLFRTAAQMTENSRLRQTIARSFGKRRGFAMMPAENWAEHGFVFEAEYVLTDDQVTGCARGAQALWRPNMLPGQR